MAETVMYDVHDCKVRPMTSDAVGASPAYGAWVDVVGIAQAGLDPNFATAQLKGDAKVLARKGRVDAFTMNLTYGKLSQEVLKVVLGGTIGSEVWSLRGTNSLPYFEVAFAINDLDIGLGSVIVRLHKAQLTGGTLVGGQTDNFSQPTMQITGIPSEGTDEMFVSIGIHAALTAIA